MNTFKIVGPGASSRLRWLALLLVLCAVLAASPVSARPLTVLAAASLQNALSEVASAYERAGGGAVRLSFAASGALARQIEQGAAADVFISADEAWMDYLQQRGLIAATTRRALLGNRLVLVVPASRPVDIALTPGVDLRRLFKPGERWVTGDPASVPVGRYAQQALTALDAWPWMQARLASADNVRAALAFVERGEAAAGIVYRTDALLSSRVHVAGVFSSGTHAPIVYPAAALAGGDLAGAQRFLDYLRGASGTGPGQARAVFLRHGFDTLP